MLKPTPEGIAALRRVLKESNYLFLMKVLRGAGSFVDPWYDFNTMRQALEELSTPYKHSFFLLQMGIGSSRPELEAEIGKEALDGILSTGLWEEKDGTVNCCNLIVLTYEGLYLVTELNPWFENCQNRNTDVYIGSDSLRLAENISFRPDAAVLDLCSGTGIQGLMAAKSARKVVSVEINPKAVPVTRFNVLLNGAENIMEVRQGDLYSVLAPDEKFDCIYANPPFIPMLDDVVYPICGTGGEDGLQVLKSIIAGLPDRLNPGGESVIFCECLGDESGVFFDDTLEAMCREQGWSCIAAHTGRGPGNHQIERLADLTALFQEEFNKQDFIRRMRENYANLGAGYLYDILYRIENTGHAAFEKADFYNPWHVTGRAEVAENAASKRKEGCIWLCLGSREIRMVSPDVEELISVLREGYTIEEAAKWLYFKYKKTLIGRKTSFYGYLAAVLNSCRLLEKDGILKRVSDKKDS